MVRLPECDGGGVTTVLAHYRLSPYNGISMKPPDIMGAWCCAKCHDLVDGRSRLANLTRAEIRLAHAEGVIRTVVAIEEMTRAA